MSCLPAVIGQELTCFQHDIAVVMIFLLSVKGLNDLLYSDIIPF